MLFSNPSFLFAFLPVLLGLYLVTPKALKNLLLAIASAAFYIVGEREFLVWFAASIALNYVIGIGIDARRGTRDAKALLALGIFTDLALLVIFKYGNFLVGNINALAAQLGFERVYAPYVALPLGISFFTFHKISYKVDVYRGTCEVKRSPIDLSLYILFFPQLIAGPIVRYKEMAADLLDRRLSLEGFSAGVRRFVYGLSKKMLVANTLAEVADAAFSMSPDKLGTPFAWAGIICYALQIYYDFSGYSDMAIGLAKMFGFTFPENFDHPYISRSVTEFWRRWHMSLSRWFRDYLYIPLGGSKGSKARTYINLATVFLLCGFWHGAAWQFLVWGALHGLLLILERAGFSRVLEKGPKIFATSYTVFAVLICWVFFRAENLGGALSYLRAMFAIGDGQTPREVWVPFASVLHIFTACFAIFFCAPIRGMIKSHVLIGHGAERPGLRLAQLGLVAVLFMLCVGQVAYNTYNPFIYFRF